MVDILLRRQPSQKISENLPRSSCQLKIISLLPFSFVLKVGKLPCYYSKFLLQVKESTTKSN